MIGETIGHFHILRLLGAGGMGEAYLAEDTLLHRQVVLKILPSIRAVSPEARIRFQREAQAAAALHHPNVVTVYEVGEHQGTPFIAMEYVDGTPLTDWVGTDEHTVDELTDVAIGVVQGLDKAHRAGMIHRDIKPANVLIDGDGCPRILDFGIAQVSEGEQLTQSGIAVGTLAYMSPEQVEGTKLDARADLWSVGVILYELLTGRRPFAGERPAALTYEICHEDPHPIDRYNAKVPAELQRVVAKCLAKDPAERYQTAADLAADLVSLRRARTGTSTITGGWPIARKRRSPLPVAVISAAAAIVVLGALGLYLVGGDAAGPPGPAANSLVVLPFENLGAPDREYFADGLTDELSGLLGRLGALTVISHSSAMTYKNRDMTAQEIGGELNVAHVLEGTVRWSPGSGTANVRITPRVVRAADNAQIWTDTYERRVADVFAVQTEIAERVAAALDIVLGAGEQRQLAARNAPDPQAYDLFLRANDFFNRGFSKENLESAVSFYRRALTIDPTFALALARLSCAHAKIFWFAYDPTPERLQRAKDAVDQALSLEPDLPEAHIAMGYYLYWGLRDYDRALTEFRIAEASRPNSSELMAAIGYVLRRQGDFDSALVHLELASRLDPRDDEKLYEIGNTLYRLRSWERADVYLQRASALSPDWAPPYARRARLMVYAYADLDSARAILTRAADHVPTGGIAEEWTWLEVLAGNYDAAASHSGRIADPVFHHLELGRILRLAGDEEAARLDYEIARRDLETWVVEDPDDANLRRYLGICYAGLGMAAEAEREGLAAMRIVPVEKDPFFVGPSNIEGLARIYAATGKPDKAINQLEILLNLPAGLITPAYLRMAPEYASLRSNPRFQGLVQEASL